MASMHGLTSVLTSNSASISLSLSACILFTCSPNLATGMGMAGFFPGKYKGYNNHEKRTQVSLEPCIA